MQSNQYGIINLLLIIVATFLIAGFVVFRIQSSTTNNEALYTVSEEGRDCSEPQLTTEVIDFADIERIAPPGYIIGGHFKTHSYINFLPTTVDVRAPVTMVLTQGAKYTQENDKVQYTVQFNGPCDLVIMFDHLSNPVDSIARQFSEPPQTDTKSKQLEPIRFEVGEVVATTDGNGLQRQFDFGVYDLSIKSEVVKLPEFSQWSDDPSLKYQHAVCPYDQYAPVKRIKHYDLFGSVNSEPMPKYYCQR